MKSLIEYTHKLLIERRALQKDIAKYRGKINQLKHELHESEDMDLFLTKEMNRLRQIKINIEKDINELKDDNIKNALLSTLQLTTK